MIELLTPAAAPEPAATPPPSAVERDGTAAFAAVLSDASAPTETPDLDAQPGLPTSTLSIEGEGTSSPIAPPNPSFFDGGGPVGVKPPGIVALTPDSLQLVKLPTLLTDFAAQKISAEAEDESADSEPADTAEAVPAPVPMLCLAVPTIPPPTSVQNFKAEIENLSPRAKAEPAKAEAPKFDVVSTVPLAVPAAPIAATPSIDSPKPDTSAQAAPVTASAATTVALDDLMVASAPDSGWIDRLAGDIVMLGNGDSREATLKISPRSLGDMAIKLDMEGHRARVHFTVDTPQALTLMADGAPRLAVLVEANGLKLDGATVDLNQRRDERAPQPPEPPRLVTRARTEIARMLARTRIATATERFA